ncbi:MAG: FAD-binding oxidoreductase [Candidatus Omnitrophica bacterium]|nr:FAD-binding oxidoreductase [Candidatus Omnitrophota bacterium]
MIVHDGLENLLNYLEDTSNVKGNASLVYLPQDNREVLESFKDCFNKKISFTLSSGHTGTTGGCVPLEGAIISLENLNKIINIDQKEQIVHSQSGITLEDLEKEVNKFNLTLRASPTESLAFVGGAIATSASGVRGFGYGSIRKYVIGLEVALTTGEIINIKRDEIIAKGRCFDFEQEGRNFKFSIPSYQLPNVKSQAGYYAKDNMDLIDLFIGSEGTLGVIVSCELKLQKIPFNIFDGLIFFPQEIDALNFVEEVKELKRKGEIKPASLEFFDKNSLELLKNEYSFIPDSEAGVYFEQEVEDETSFELLLLRWQELIEGNKGLLDESIIADTPEQRKRVFDFRHKLPQMINEFLRNNNQVKVASDIAVPDDKFNQMYDFYKKIAKEARIRYVNFGHIGESHLHFNFLPSNDQENREAKEYLKKLCQRGVSLGGTVSAEHGIGKIKKPYLKIMYNETEIKEMTTVKKYFDPLCLLGLDNIFDKEMLASSGRNY